MLVAVEDDEVEVLDLLGEQLARREGDERELVDRRAVLLLRRAQNGEVHEIDGGVGLQQVAPHALAGVRLAGDQQHAQVLAHALGRHHDAVVGRGELARRRLQLDLDDVLAGVRERHLDRHGAADLRCVRVSSGRPSRRILRVTRSPARPRRPVSTTRASISRVEPTMP